MWTLLITKVNTDREDVRQRKQRRLKENVKGDENDRKVGVKSVHVGKRRKRRNEYDYSIIFGIEYFEC